MLGLGVFIAFIISVGFFIVVRGNRYSKTLAEIEANTAKWMELARQKEQRLSAKYSEEYEQRKLTIGTIKCSQCKWSGQWGTGMSYEQFFAGDLAEHGINVGRPKGEKSSLSLNNRQYECPVCNSLSWKKV
jgi:hypothetical protein